MVGVAQVVEHRVVAPVVVGSSPITHPNNPELSDAQFRYAPVAQLDRAPDFESVGRPFESGRAYHKNKKDMIIGSYPFLFQEPANTSCRFPP
jgi:hypothetical protein